MTTSFYAKLKACHENGRLDFLAGAPCDPSAVREIYSDLNEARKTILVWAWLDGWNEGKKILPEGMTV